MATKNPRVLTVLDEPLFRAVRQLARSENISISQKIRDLVRDAIESHEDARLLRMAEDREKTFDRRKALSHQQVFGTRRG